MAFLHGVQADDGRVQIGYRFPDAVKKFAKWLTSGKRRSGDAVGTRTRATCFQMSVP